MFQRRKRDPAAQHVNQQPPPEPILRVELSWRSPRACVAVLLALPVPPNVLSHGITAATVGYTAIVALIAGEPITRVESVLRRTISGRIDPMNT
jgi:hypothetical protein